MELTRTHKHTEADSFRRTTRLARRGIAVSFGISKSALIGVVVLAVGAASYAATSDPVSEKLSSNPTVGTLPVTGELPGFDQAIGLRANVGALRKAVCTAGEIRGGDSAGMVNITPLPDDSAWVRFLGDVRVELDLDAVSDVSISLFSGFDGQGMHFVLDYPGGVSPIYGMETGVELELDPARLLEAGLLDQPLIIRAIHRTGVSSVVSVEVDPVEMRVVLHQDV